MLKTLNLVLIMAAAFKVSDGRLRMLVTCNKLHLFLVTIVGKNLLDELLNSFNFSLKDI